MERNGDERGREEVAVVQRVERRQDERREGEMKVRDKEEIRRAEGS